MHGKSFHLIFMFLGLNLFFGSFIILNEIRFEFYRFYTPMLMNPVLASSKIDFAAWLIFSIIILIVFLFTLNKLNKALIKNAYLTLIFLLTASLFIFLFKLNLVFLILVFWLTFFSLIYLINLKFKASKLKLLSLIASPPLFLIALIAFLSSLFFLFYYLKSFYILPIEFERKIINLNIQIFYVLYALTEFLILTLTFIWFWCPLTSLIKLNIEFNLIKRFTHAPLIASLILSSVLVGLPYLTRVGFIGVDAQWYFKALNQIKNFKSLSLMFTHEPRSFYLSILWFISILTASKETAVKFGPIFLSIIHIIAVFAFIYAVTKDNFLSGLSSFLAAFSFQATVGMYAGIYANWFSLSTAVLSLAFLIKAFKEKFKFIIPSIVFSIISMLSHPWTGIIIFSILIVYGLINLGYSAIKKFKERLKEVLCVLSLIAVNIALIAIAFIKSSGLSISLQAGSQILQSIKLSNAFTFLENFRFSLKFYVGGFFIAPIIYLIGLTAAPIIFKEKILLKLFASWFIVTFFLLVFSDLWLKWRILYLMPFQILSCLGYIYLMKIFNKALLLKITLTTALFLQLFNYTLQCMLFIPEY
ncbi:hypothetical protein KEJ50_05570 [Candidatus Bathyarchaeota archaeon]|nr:hypothetical protein [Candidatus Bathyarchaeota archaeon]